MELINICTWHAPSNNGAFQKLVKIDGNDVLFSDLLTVKPTFSFDYISFEYVEQANRFNKTIEVSTTIGDETIIVQQTVELTEEEKAEVLANIGEVIPPFSFYYNHRKNQILTDYNVSVQALAGSCDQYETASWEIQKSEALAWNSDETTPTPFIDQLLLARNASKPETEQETKAALVGKILVKVQAYNSAYAAILGTEQSRMKVLDSLTTIDELLAYAM